MKLIRGLHAIPAEWKECVLTIGNFDGIHRGHQALISRCVLLAKQHNTVSVVMTFEPYPKTYFSNKKNYNGNGADDVRLTGVRDKFLALSELGVDYLLILKFNALLASINPFDFIRTILVDCLKIKAVIVGDDF